MIKYYHDSYTSSGWYDDCQNQQAFPQKRQFRQFLVISSILQVSPELMGGGLENLGPHLADGFIQGSIRTVHSA